MSDTPGTNIFADLLKICKEEGLMGAKTDAELFDAEARIEARVMTDTVTAPPKHVGVLVVCTQEEAELLAAITRGGRDTYDTRTHRAVPIAEMEAEAEKWPVPECICTHEGKWHRYDCPKFNARDYTHSSEGAAPGEATPTDDPMRCGGCGHLETDHGDKWGCREQGCGCWSFSPSPWHLLMRLESSESENARLKRALQEARKEYQTSIKMYIVENRRLNSELAAYREVLEKIAEAKGPYSRDQLTFAENTIEAMRKTATDALASLPPTGEQKDG